MCGICGFAGDGIPSSSHEIIRAMCMTLKHRGPDDDGFFVCEAAAIGMRRLSIIDLTGGKQPMASEDGRIQTVMNGEIYNFRELARDLQSRGHTLRTRSDTEVIPHLYEEHGEDFAWTLNGMFGIAIWDTANRKLLVVRDRMGVKPVYYAHVNGVLYFGSELKAILAVPDFERRIDATAVDAYLTYSYVPPPMSIFKNVKKLAPGEMLTFCDGRLEVKRWWTLPDCLPLDITCEEASDRLRELISDSVKMRLISDVPIGAFLSGGIDSTTIAAYAAKFSPHIKSFAIGFDEDSYDESGFAREAARRIGTDHHEHILSMSAVPPLLPAIFSMLDEPISDGSLLPTWLLSRFTRGQVTVALSGDGADELFAGYPTYQAHKFFSIYNALPGALKSVFRRCIELIPASDRYLTLGFKLKRFMSSGSLDMVERHFTWAGQFSRNDKSVLLSDDYRYSLEAAGDIFAIPRSLISKYHHLKTDAEKAIWLDLMYYLGEDLLTKIDRTSMMHSLEVRTPFLDYRIVEFAASLPMRLKLNGLKTKYVLKKAVKHDVPNFVIKRRKKGFAVPLSAWIKKELKQEFLETLGKDRIGHDGIFSPAAVSGLLCAHLEGKADNSRKLWNLYVFNKWMDNWLRP